MLRAVLFDMDGTLTQPLIDWPDVRRRLEVAEGASIMDHIEAQDGHRRDRAESLLKQIEFEAATAALPNDGVVELIDRLRQRGLKTGLVTNNHQRAMEHIVEKLGLRFDLLLSREDGIAKPAPDLLILALERLGLKSSEALFVGDGRYDRAAAAAADLSYIHLDHDPAAAPNGPTVHKLAQVWQLLEPLMSAPPE